MTSDCRKSSHASTGDRLVLVSGASGYIGGRLWPLLIERGLRVRLMTRRRDALLDVDGAEVVEADALNLESLSDALRGVDQAFYLIHSMQYGADFEKRDRQAARNFGDAARRVGLRRIVYLGGLSSDDEEPSPHMRSRHEVGEILRESGVPTIELRASIVIGHGSLSFEMTRSLVERLPAMVTPRWVAARAQPIYIGDLLRVLIGAMELDPLDGPILEIGGADRTSYGGLMREYARRRGLRRFMVPVPVLTPRLSSHWLGLVTPLYARIGRSLIESIRSDSVITRPEDMARFDVRPVGVAESIHRALKDEDREFAAMDWSKAEARARRWGCLGAALGSRFFDSRTARVRATPSRAFAPIRRIGGERGWYYGDWLWALRGWLDRLIGGPGMSPPRRNPERLEVGDRFDCWRVEAIEPDRRLLLRAEMRLPGRAWLEFRIEQSDASPGEIVIRQTAIFDPLGLLGRLYWLSISPLHALVFRGMLRGAVERIEQKNTTDHSCPK